MHIGINFWLEARLSDFPEFFYFPLDKYYDRAAKKSCQDLNCKNCLEVTHFGVLKTNRAQNDYHFFCYAGLLLIQPLALFQSFANQGFKEWNLFMVRSRQTLGNKWPKQPQRSLLIVSLSTFNCRKCYPSHLKLTFGQNWTFHSRKFKVSGVTFYTFKAHISLFQKWVNFTLLKKVLELN